MKAHGQAFPLDGVDLFRVKENTSVKICINDPETGLHQFVELKRKHGDEVIARLRDYAGDFFSMEISLADEVARTISPNFSTFDAQDVGGTIVLKRICEILEEHRM